MRLTQRVMRVDPVCQEEGVRTDGSSREGAGGSPAHAHAHAVSGDGELAGHALRDLGGEGGSVQWSWGLKTCMLETADLSFIPWRKCQRGRGSCPPVPQGLLQGKGWTSVRFQGTEWDPQTEVMSLGSV